MKIPESRAPRDSAGDKDRELAAGMWLARRDRGLSAAEEAELGAWLRADFRHQMVLQELEASFHALDRARLLRPPLSLVPDPDLLVSTRPPKSWLLRLPTLAVLGAAAALVFGLFVYREQPARQTEPAAVATVTQQSPQQLTLPDGSLVDLRDLGRIEVDFTPTVRRVRLSGGEAHFTVTKNPERPFIVMAGDVAVRAVGTAFSVSRGQAEVQVFVTEGRVRVDDAIRGASLLAGRPPALPDPAGPGAVDSDEPALPVLEAGEGVLISITEAGPLPAPVTALTQGHLDSALDWRRPWVEFAEMPLTEVVAIFNKHNVRKLQVADEVTGRILVTGSFRVDSPEVFVRLLEFNFGVKVSQVSEEHAVLQMTR